MKLRSRVWRNFLTSRSMAVAGDQKFSVDYRIFAGGSFHELKAIRKQFICECLVLVDKDRPIALIRENIICKIPHNYSAFVKTSRYTVSTFDCLEAVRLEFHYRIAAHV